MYIKHYIKYTHTTGVPMQGFLLGGGKGTLAPPKFGLNNKLVLSW